MDSVTHLVAGALTPLMFRNAPKTRMLTVFGIICGEFPDIDALAGKSAESVLAFHRSFTHALVLQPVSALLLALLFHRFLKKGDRLGSWSFAKTWSVALLALLIHLFLDCMTTFGTQIFQPFSAYRVAVPAVYVIDLLMTLPLLGVWIWILRRGGVFLDDASRLRPARAALVWIFLYPALCLGINAAATSSLEARYAAPGNSLGITRVELSPEPFAPFNWKVVGIAPDQYHMAQFLAFSPGRELTFTPYTRPSSTLWETLQRRAPLFRTYDAFATYVAQDTAETRDSSGSAALVHTFRDVRYESTLPGLMEALGRTDGLFLMQARTEPQGALRDYRFLYRGREDAETPWLPFTP